jgi:hypothetical protein
MKAGGELSPAFCFEKHQHPSAKHQKNSKLQSPKRANLTISSFGIWSFSELGSWCLELVS